MSAYDAVLVVSFGGPEGPGDVLPFLERVTAGRGVPAERLERVASQYMRFGGVSPLNAEVRAFIELLRKELRGRGLDQPLYWGNRNWHPLLSETVQAMAADGVRAAIAYVTSAFGSYSGCRQYMEDIEAARRGVEGAPLVDKLVPFFDRPGFVEASARGALSALARLPSSVRAEAEIVFCAHSIPLEMSRVSPYVAQLQACASLVADLLGRSRWSLAFQSRSGAPSQPWLEPDILEHLSEVAERAPAVVLVPLGFVAEHMEVVHDLDLVATDHARHLGLEVARAPTVGRDPGFVSMVGDLLAEKLGLAPAAPGLSDLVTPDPCPPGCCYAPGRLEAS